MGNEFVIKDLKSGKYRSAIGWNADDIHAVRYWYQDACRTIALQGYCDDVRIVEAPPKRLTDEECWAWLKENHDCHLGYAPGYGQWYLGIAGVRTFADTPLDAIRAAAAKCSE